MFVTTSDAFERQRRVFPRYGEDGQDRIEALTNRLALAPDHGQPLTIYDLHLERVAPIPGVAFRMVYRVKAADELQLMGVLAPEGVDEYRRRGELTSRHAIPPPAVAEIAKLRGATERQLLETMQLIQQQLALGIDVLGRDATYTLVATCEGAHLEHHRRSLQRARTHQPDLLHAYPTLDPADALVIAQRSSANWIKHQPDTPGPTLEFTKRFVPRTIQRDARSPGREPSGPGREL